ncbi:hypothetical protein GCM10009193_22520 [Shewanella aestuarii]|nr:hypothetical protein GCM10009193_22520 [Shewanella aestuarii]
MAYGAKLFSTNSIWASGQRATIASATIFERIYSPIPSSEETGTNKITGAFGIKHFPLLHKVGNYNFP